MEIIITKITIIIGLEEEDDAAMDNQMQDSSLGLMGEDLKHTIHIIIFLLKYGMISHTLKEGASMMKGNCIVLTKG